MLCHPALIVLFCGAKLSDGGQRRNKMFPLVFMNSNLDNYLNSETQIATKFTFTAVFKTHPSALHDGEEGKSH